MFLRNCKSQAQESDKQSTISVYKALASLRKNETFIKGDTVLKDPSDNLLVFSRNLDEKPSYLIAMNLGYAKETFKYQYKGEVVTLYLRSYLNVVYLQIIECKN